MCIDVLAACIPMDHMHAENLETRRKYLKLEIQLEVLCGYMRLGWGPLEEQPVLLIIELYLTFFSCVQKIDRELMLNFLYNDKQHTLQWTVSFQL